MNKIESDKPLAPVVLFVYARPDHTERTLDALEKKHLASETDLIIYSDAPKHAGHAASLAAVRALIQRYNNNFQSVVVHEQPANLGSARSVIAGVSAAIDQYGRVVIVEDDLGISACFLSFMNQALVFYQNDPKVFSVSGYALPAALMKYSKGFDQDVCLIPRHCSWGWTIWQDRWAGIDWEVKDYAAFRQDEAARSRFNRGGTDLSASLDMQMQGKLDSWAIRCVYAGFRRGQWPVYSRTSFVDNSGLDGTGVHCGKTPVFRNDLGQALTSWRLPAELTMDPRIAGAFTAAFKTPWTQTAKLRVRNVVEKLGLLPPVPFFPQRVAA